MSTYTLAPAVSLTLANGQPNSLGFVATYQAGTTTPAPTYIDVGGLTTNTNPIQLDAGGNVTASGSGYAGIYLVPGSSYKFVVQDANSVTIRTQDNILATPTGAATGLPTGGTAGQVLTSNGPAMPSSFQNLPTVGGSWTPAEAHVTLTSVTGRYFVVGKLVVCFYDVTWPSTGDTNAIEISGLPAVCGNSFGAQRGFSGIGFSAWAGGQNFFSYVNPNTSNFQIYKAGGAAMENVDFTGVNIAGAVIYESV